MPKIIFGCMNIGNEKDSTINLIEAIQSSELIICENLNKFKTFIKKTLIKTDAEIVEWDYDFINTMTTEYVIGKQQSIAKKINKSIDNNKNVLIISDEGSCLLLDPGNYFLKFCIENKIKYEIQPGPSAVIQSFLNNKIFTSDSAEFYFCGWFSNKTTDQKFKLLELIKNISHPSIMFLWHQTFIKDIEFILNNNINNNSTLCIDLTTEKEFVLSDNLLNIYNKVISNEIKIDNNSLISLIIN